MSTQRAKMRPGVSLACRSVRQHSAWRPVVCDILRVAMIEHPRPPNEPRLFWDVTFLISVVLCGPGVVRYRCQVVLTRRGLAVLAARTHFMTDITLPATQIAAKMPMTHRNSSDRMNAMMGRPNRIAT
jgi:hypothetical protein